MYTTIEDTIAGEIVMSIVRENADGSRSIIPADESNSDYQAYLAFLAEQETA